MPESRDASPGEDYFNDLSQQPGQASDHSAAGLDERRGSQEDGAIAGQLPKPKRIACVLCRRRKLRCDGAKPSCATCARLQHDCSYDEVRKKSGPKRGYVKALEARLAQVETLLKTQDDPPAPSRSMTGGGGGGQTATAGAVASGNGMMPDYADLSLLTVDGDPSSMLGGGMGDAQPEEAFSWEMIGLGLDEPMPNQDVVNELNQAYFDKIHPSAAMMHRPRYYAAMNLAPHMRPPVCLRYAMWCNAATVTDKFEGLSEHFYLRARKYIQQDEMRGHGESMISVAHAQTWILLATYEFKLMYFPRAWMSAGRACRMVQMMGLHRLDGTGLDVKQCLPPPKDWTEREERRRTFWMAFSIDRYSSIGTGWPMTIEEKDIMTGLPSDEESYELSKGGKSLSLEEALSVDGASKLTSFAGVLTMACLFGRNLTHLHRPGPDDNDSDLNGDFWKRHREMDNVLLNIALALPDPLRMPSGINDHNAVFLNMCIHTSTICLHQAAIFKADRNRMPSRVSAESKVRCITAAAETASIMRQVCHLDLSAMNPFVSFSLYVAARVFVQYLKSRPKDIQIRTSLQFLLAAMQAIKRKNPLTESFLVQLDVDLEGAGLEDATSTRIRPAGSNLPHLPKYPVRSEGCPVSQLGVGENSTPNYNNINVAGYTNGADGTNPANGTATAPSQHHAFGTNNLPGFSNESTMGFISGMQQYELPSRYRSPGSHQGSNVHRSPPSFNMDTSPDGSGGDNQTPNSSNQSQQNNISAHTSHTGYSPQSMQQQQDVPTPGRLMGVFAPNDTSFADFDMQNYSTTATTGDSQQQGYVLSATGLPSTWGSGGTGFTPGPTGMTPGPNGMVGDVLGLSDEDWNAMMETMNFSPWQSNGGVGQEGIAGMRHGSTL